MKCIECNQEVIQGVEANENEGLFCSTCGQKFEWAYVEKGFKTAVAVNAILFIPVYFLSGFIGILVMVAGLFGSFKLLQILVKRIGTKRYSSYQEYSKNKGIKSGFGWVVCFFSFCVASLVAIEVSQNVLS